MDFSAARSFRADTAAFRILARGWRIRFRARQQWPESRQFPRKRRPLHIDQQLQRCRQSRLRIFDRTCGEQRHNKWEQWNRNHRRLCLLAHPVGHRWHGQRQAVHGLCEQHLEQGQQQQHISANGLGRGESTQTGTINIQDQRAFKRPLMIQAQAANVPRLYAAVRKATPLPFPAGWR